MSRQGASGLFLAGLLERLGIAEAVRRKAVVIESGFTAELAANGVVQLALQQVSELLVVPGVEIVGRLPAALGGSTVFFRRHHVRRCQSGCRRRPAGRAGGRRRPDGHAGAGAGLTHPASDQAGPGSGSPRVASARRGIARFLRAGASQDWNRSR